jgi:hypothetical protein
LQFQSSRYQIFVYHSNGKSNYPTSFTGFIKIYPYFSQF